MNIVEFPQRASHAGWQANELQQLVALFDANTKADINSWAVGTTERGDPQFYVLGPAPQHDCVLSVSRLPHGYLLEDGRGHVISEAPSLDAFAEEAARAAVRASRSFVARLAIVACAIRLTIEEKIEPVMEESMEILVRLVPPLAALA
jgi:hypothetical protein